MSNLVTDSLEYLAGSDKFLRTVAIGGVVMFAHQLFLGAVFTSVTSHGGVLNSWFGGGASMAIWGGLTLLGLVSFVVLSGFYVRIAQRVIAGEDAPPRFANGPRLVRTGVLYCVTLLVFVAIALAVQIALVTILVTALTLLDVFLGLPYVDAVRLMIAAFSAVVTAVAVVYPQPSIWILIARFRRGRESGGSYFRFVASRRFVSELGSILLSRKYVTSWIALVVVSILQGAATIEGNSIFAVTRPVELVIRLNTRFVSSIIGFYTSVAVVFIFATRFRESDPYRQTSFSEFASGRDAGGR